MPYIHFTEDQKLRANSVDLVEFLRRQGEKLISSGQDKRLTSDHSITVHGNEWYDHAAERGGHAISFVQNFYGLTYPEAVTRLLNGEQGEVYIPAEKKEKEPPKEFALPPSNQAMRRVYAYLLQQRHISREVLSAFAQKGLIYESRELSIDQTKVYHNAVFVGFDERGVARHAHKRGLYTQGKSYRGNIEGSDPRCSFHWVGTKGDLFRNYAGIAKDCYGYQIAVLDLRNPTRSDGNNLLHLINKYMDIYKADPKNLAAKAKAEK